MKNDLKIENSFENTGSYVLYKYEVTATVTDAMTEQQSEAKMEISIHSQPNKIILQAPKVFDPDTNIEFKVKVSITDLDDKPIEDKGSPIKIIIECNSGSELTSLGYEPVKTEFTHHIGKDPSIKLENRNFSECSLYAEYEGVRSRSEIIQKNVDTFFLDVLTESPEVGKKLLMKLKSSDPIDHFSYDIVSRGDIIQSTHVKVPDNQKIHIFGFDVTYAMVPKITVYVHRVDSRIFAGQIKDIFTKRAFQNSIQITTDEEAKPGSLVNINVTTDKNSYVGLMALDHRILQGINSLDDLTEDHFYTKLRNYDASSIDTSSFPGIKAGLITFTNAFTKLGTRFGEDDIIPIFGILPQDRDENLPEQFDKPSLEFPRLRKLFSESWLYKDFENTPAGGLNLMETAPDAITSWAITGFSLNPTTGLTLTKKATNFKVFQDFFVSIDLPNSVKEGETVEVPIYISNYMKKDAMTNVMIEKHSDNIEIFKTPDTVLKPKEAISKLVPAGKREKVLVFLKPLKSGLHNVTVKALSPMASDAILKTLSVKSDGVPYEISKTHLIHLPEEGSDEKEITIDIPPNAVAGSQSVELSIAGDVFRPLLASLQKNARVPYGNGEDNMRFIISNSLVLEYHKVLNHTSPSLENKIKLYLEIGYQNQQCFQHLDGSFGLFDKKTERSGDIWQTAFALWGLRQSKKFIKIDSKVFERGLKYLKERQEESGGFTSREGIKKDLEYTAFIVIVFLMDNDWRTAHNDVIFKGLNYLYEKSNNLEQSSVSVLSTYVLLLGRHEKARERVKQLTKTASLKNKKMLWEGVDTVQSHLETTADCLMNLFESNKKVRQNFHIIQGLIASDDGKTSLTHMIALHAMIILVDGLNLSRTNLSILYKEEDQRKFGKFQVNSENSQMIPTFKLSEKSQKIKFQSKGYGFAVVDVKYKYNLVNDVESSSSYAANITILKTTNYLTVFKVCASDFRNDDEHHLTVMEVNLQSGYIFTERATPDVGLTWKFKSIKVDPSQDKVVVYIENLNKIGNCLNVEALKKYNVINAKPGWLVLYDTHKRDEKIAKSFKLNES
ncbi:CD109 antigen-like [Episyrphus balteatus]|uniref:CD109 antigen-like n=1 Tax=Episyrphus balteatus TaxID=286459 RepID=UPI00248571D0|nr:CD109 antigen-like [Episyrphus balteatus]